MTRQRNLTEDQITGLFDFVRRKRVRFYDLQVELVDHLATGIEQIWEEEPQASFENARDRVYREFGITGFAHVVDARMNAIGKQVWREAGSFLLSRLYYPEILRTLLVCLALTNLLTLLPNPEILSLLLLLLMVFLFVRYQYRRPVWYSQKVRFIRSEGVKGAASIIIGSAQLLCYYLPMAIHEMAQWDVVFAALGSVIIYALGCLCYALTYYADRRAKEDLAEQFPHLVPA
jgi:hypothetical protein